MGMAELRPGYDPPGAGFYLKMDNSSTWNPATDSFLGWDNATGDLPIGGNFI